MNLGSPALAADLGVAEFAHISLIALSTLLVPLAILYWVFIAGRRRERRDTNSLDSH